MQCTSTLGGALAVMLKEW